MENKKVKQIWSWEEYIVKTRPSALRKLIRKSLNRIARLTVFPQIRLLAYRMMGVHIGKGVFIGPDCYFDDTFPELIHIEDDVTVSFRVTIAVHGESRIRGTTKVSPVLIRKNAFIGTGAIILPGIEIGEKAVVGAGAVVAEDVPSETTVIGVPARVLCKRQEYKDSSPLI
jgi:acetyltransferase-like isoleucine patch superfamily enzyme